MTTLGRWHTGVTETETFHSNHSDAITPDRHSLVGSLRLRCDFQFTCSEMIVLWEHIQPPATAVFTNENILFFDINWTIEHAWSFTEIHCYTRQHDKKNLIQIDGVLVAGYMWSLKWLYFWVVSCCCSSCFISVYKAATRLLN